jgi:hypothetical protein
MGRWLALWSVGSSLLLLGCQSTLPSCETPAPPAPSEYALVEYRLRETGDGAPKVEISDTETYRAEHTRYTTAALRLPDACLAEGASAASASTSALSPPCAEWLSAIEQALTSAGFRVMAWDAVWRLEREKSLSTYNAAKELGAEIVFVFNALDAATITAGSSKIPKHEYFESDEQGRRGIPLTLDEQTRSAFLKYTLDAAAKSLEPASVIALSASLDSTAIVTQTGESVWFYRRTVTRPTEAKQGLKLLFGRVNGGGWTPAAPVAEGAAPVPAAAAAAPEQGDAGAPPPEARAPEQARAELVRVGAEHFVRSFKNGAVEASDPGGER